ncbi:MAG: hypothetical protein AAF975_02395 [Spirochaetota bacterium]
MAKKNKKKPTERTAGIQTQILSELQQATKYHRSNVLRSSEVLKESPHRGSIFFGYRQQMAANAIQCRRMSELINVIQAITRYLNALSRPYLRASQSETEAGFQIRHRDSEKKIGAKERSEIKELEQIISQCGIDNNISEDTLASYVSKLVRDYIAIDQFTSQILYSVSGEILGFCAVDTATMIPLLPKDRERTGFEFVQIVDNLEFSMFSEKEIVLSVGNPHNDMNDLRLLGTPVVLTASNLLYSHIAAEQHNSDRFRQDHFPRGMVLLNGAEGVQEVEAMQDFFIGLMNSENGSMPWGIPFVPSLTKEGKVEFINFNQSNRDMEFSQLYEIGMSMIGALFQVDITELGIRSSHSGRMENNQQLGRFVHAGDRSLGTILAFIERHLNQIVERITPDYIFIFTGKKQIDGAKEQAEEKHKLSTHYSINELRSEKDLKTWGETGDPLWNLPHNADVRSFLQQSDHYLTINEQRSQLGMPPLKGDWADKIPVSMAQSAYSQEAQAEAEEPTEEPAEMPETPELPDLTEGIEKSLGAQKKTWPFRELEIFENALNAKINKIERSITATLNHALGLPEVLDAEVTKSLGKEFRETLEGEDFLIWKGTLVYDPESGRPIKKKEFAKLLAAIRGYIDKYALNAEEIVLTPEIIGRIIGRSYINGDDYEKLAALEFERNKVQYRGYNFTDISADLEGIRRIFNPSDKELVRIEYAVDNAAHLLQRASDGLIEDVRKIVTESVIKQSSKRKTAETLRMRLGEYNRDWLKIANTELVDAHCNGIVAEIAASTPLGEPVLLERLELYDIAVCDVCAKFNHQIAMLVEGERDFDTAPESSLAEVMIWDGKNNHRRKKADWWLSIGTIHPNCRGSWRYISKEDAANRDEFWERKRKRDYQRELERQAREIAYSPVIMPDGTKRSGKGNYGTVLGELKRKARAEGKL